MPDSIGSTNLAIQILLDKREEIQRECDAQCAEIDANVARLRGQPTPGEFLSAHRKLDLVPSVRPGLYAGMNRKSALQAYLNERPGGVLVTKASKDLLEGGAPMGKDKTRYRRYLRTTIKQNPKVFEYNEDQDTVRLKNEVPTSVHRRAI